MATTVITGTNRGIGLELVRACVARGDTVFAVCRKPSSELEGSGATIVSGIDVSDDASMALLAKQLGGKSINTLINNAGILERNSLDDLDLDSIRRQFEVNSLGPLRVTATLTPMLASGAKVAIVTSRMGSLTDNTSGSHYGYRMSKAAVNMAGVSLAHDLAGAGVAVVLLHPGYVKTEMTGGNGNVAASEAAAGLLAQIERINADATGQFLHADGQALPW